MRAVLARLADGEWHIVVKLPYDPEVEYDGIYPKVDYVGIDRAAKDRAAEESYRRACKRLAAMGLVELGYRGMHWLGRYRIRPVSKPEGQRAQLVVRLKRAEFDHST